MALTETPATPLGSPAPDFELSDPRGTTHRLSDHAGQITVVMFLCNHCPFVRHIADHLATFAARHQEDGVAFLAVNANDAESYPQDGPGPMAEEANRRGYPFPYLHDADQTVARAYGAVCTPDFFVYDSAHRLAYRGRYDGSRPANDIPVTGEDLAATLEALKAGRPAPTAAPSMGCSIKWKR